VFGISGADQGSEATSKVSNGDVDGGNGANGIRETTNDDRYACSVEVDLRASEKSNGISPNAGELIAFGGVQKKLFTTVGTTRGGKGSEELGGRG